MCRTQVYRQFEKREEIMANNNHGTLFINKILQTEDFGNFAKFGITEESFVSAADREAYRFIADRKSVV